MDILEFLWAYALVFLLAAVPMLEVVAIIPMGIIAGLATVPVAVFAILGNLVTVILVILLIDQIKAWRNRRKKSNGEVEEEKESKRSERAKKLWDKYGLPGLAFIGPFFVGSHISAFMSVVLGGSRKKVILWMGASLVFWGVLMAVITHLGFDFFQERTGQDGLLLRLLNKEN